MKEVEFALQGESLWINIEMHGLYFITYTYQVWASKASDPPVITNPIRSGTNESPHDDNFQVKNDFVPNEPVALHHERVIDVRFWVKKAKADDGYHLKVSVLQGPSFQAAKLIGEDETGGSVGGLSVKEEFITIKLIAQ